MPFRSLAAALPAAILLAGCQTTVQPGDGAPPTLNVVETVRGLPVIVTTRADQTPAPALCPDGSRPIEGDARSIDNTYEILDADQDRITMAFFFADPSGIRSASVIFDARTATVHSPDLPVETRAAHGGGTGRFRVWEFEGAGTLRSPQTLTLEITPVPSPPGTPIEYSATDGTGNAMSGLFFVARSEAYCR